MGPVKGSPSRWAFRAARRRSRSTQFSAGMQRPSHRPSFSSPPCDAQDKGSEHLIRFLGAARRICRGGRLALALALTFGAFRGRGCGLFRQSINLLLLARGRGIGGKCADAGEIYCCLQL